MSLLPRADVDLGPPPAGSAEELVAALRRLRAQVGHPSLRTLSRIAGHRIAAAPGAQRPEPLPPSTTSDVLSGKRLPRLPRLEFVESFVAACLHAGRVDEPAIAPEVARWRAVWCALAVPEEPAAPLPAPRSRGWTRRQVSLPIAAALLAGLIAAAAIVVTTNSAPGRPAEAAHAPAPLIAEPGANPNCDQDDAPLGSNLLDVPHRHPSGDSKMDAWWPNDGHIKMGPYGPREFDTTVRGGRPDIWNLVIVRSCLPVHADRQYRLRLTARADRPVTIRIRVQEPEGAVMSFSTDLHVGPHPQRLDTLLTARATSRQDELMFQVGGQPDDYHLRVTEISLTS